MGEFYQLISVLLLNGLQLIQQVVPHVKFLMFTVNVRGKKKPGDDAVNHRIWRTLEWWIDHPLTSCWSKIYKRWNMPYEMLKICDMTK